jgi:glycyl-tRNA synthetase
LEDQTVTLRERDSMQQERIAMDYLKKLIVDKVSLTSLLQQL